MFSEVLFEQTKIRHKIHSINQRFIFKFKTLGNSLHLSVEN